MTSASLQHVTIAIDDVQRVSGLLVLPPMARACYVVGHGAGAGMNHAFMRAVAEGLAERGVATLRYQFPYMERGSKRPDVARVAHATCAPRWGKCAVLRRTSPSLQVGNRSAAA